MDKKRRFTGFKGFVLIWLGQVVSVIASSMTSFGMTLWMYKQTENATSMAIMQVAFITPFLVFTPIAGVMVDRYDRKRLMIVSDLTAVISTTVVLVLYVNGALEFWHLYVASVINGIGNAFQKPAYATAISTMLPKKQYGRANGMMELLRSGPEVISPALAGMLLAISVQGRFDSFALIMLIDLMTFVLAVAAVLLVEVPSPMQGEGTLSTDAHLFRDSLSGLRYILSRPGLLGMQISYLIGNLFVVTGYAVYAPMVLARTGQDSIVYGAVQAASAFGGLAGGFVMSVWTGFKRRIHGVLVGWILFGFSIMLFGLGRNTSVWIPAMVLFSMAVALTNTSGQSIWQTKVPLDVQGRVFATRTLLSWLSRPVGPLIGGMLADKVMEPAMQTPSMLFHAFGPIFGTGPGAGMGLLIFLTSFGVMAIGFVGYCIPVIRNLEDDLPDYDESVADSSITGQRKLMPKTKQPSRPELAVINQAARSDRE